jgi:PAS domain S-box-containing protein
MILMASQAGNEHMAETAAEQNGPGCPAGGGLAQARLDGVLRAATSVSIIVTDLAGVIRVFNSGAERLLGYAADEVVGRMTPEPLHLREEMDAYGRELSARMGRPVLGFEVFVLLARQGGPETADTREWTYVRKDGSHVPVNLTVTGVYSAQGRLEGYLGLGLDLSERHGLMASLRQAQVSVDAAGDMIVWCRVADGKLVFANKAAREALGYTEEEAAGLTVMDLNPARTLEDWRAYCDEQRERGRLSVELSFRRKDGTTFPVEVTASLATHGDCEFSVGIARDISQRRALLAELHQAHVCVDNAQDMILWARMDDGGVAYANRSACETLGYGPEEFVRLNVRDVNPVRTPENWRASCDRLREVGRMRYEAVFRRRDGAPFPVEVSSSLVLHQGVEYAVGIIRDISQSKAAAARLDGEVRLNRALAEAARGLLDADMDMDATASMLLERASELTGSRHGYVAFVDELGGLHPRAMSAMAKSGECRLGALPVTFPAGPDGEYPGLWGHSLNTRLGFYSNDPAGHPASRGLPKEHIPVRRLLTAPAVSRGRLMGQIAVANAGRDYTQADLTAVESLADVFALGLEQAFSQRALREARDAAEAASLAKSLFLANMTHEVRTPLNGILGMLQVMLAGELTDEQRENAGVALESAERLHRLLGNVIEYARLDAAMDPAMDPADCRSFPPTDLLRSLEAVFAPRARDKGLAFSASAAPDLPELIVSDPQAANHILSHLLDNALKFTPAGGVELCAGPDPDDPGRIVFRVADTGIGIPPDKREQVFEAFVQADASITRTYGGAGLGLAIARRLAQRLGGELTTADRPGGGTVMTLALPLDCTNHLRG